MDRSHISGHTRARSGRFLSALARSRWAMGACLLLALLGLCIQVFGIPWIEPDPLYHVDLDVYRLGGRAILDGEDLYGRLPDTQIGSNLPFTYPPISAVLFIPLAGLPYWLASVSFSGVSLMCLAVALRISLGTMIAERRALNWLTAFSFAVLMWLAPIYSTVAYGQINLVLMAMVIVDAIARAGHKGQGILIGLAIAIKLTPAVFLAYFAIRRQWRALTLAVASAAGATAIGFLLLPHASWRYWTTILSDPSRIGNLAYVSNQSLNGLLVRLGLSDGGGPIWFLLCATLGTYLLVLMRRLVNREQDLAALLTMAFFALLASPVSWSHHWVWIAPALVLLTCWATRHPGRWLWVLIVLGFLIFLTALRWIPREPATELHWPWWRTMIAGAYVWWTFAFLAGMASRLPGRVVGAASQLPSRESLG